MAKILIVSLGGTICSKTGQDKVIKLSAAPDRSFFTGLGFKGELCFYNPISYSSENATVSYFREALSGISKGVEEHSPDGVLVLHGTDSMSYFAQLAVRVLSFLDIPVVITGAKKPLTDPSSDGKKNVRYSLNLLNAACEAKSGHATFGIVYSDSFMGDTTFVGANLATDPDYYGDIRISGARGSFTRLTREQAEQFFSLSSVPKIITVPDVPGFPFDHVDPEGCDAILIEAYHSGTANSSSREDGLPALIRRAAERNVPCYLAPVPKRRERYESEMTLRDAGIIPIEEMPIEGAWAETILRTAIK
ncbi:MAG: asparaginase [Clostridiales bacterium]|nr:asparaginase [Clostridiales bacterium]